MLQEKQFKREAAQKFSAGEILKGEFTETGDGAIAMSIAGRPVRRVNLLATVVDKDSSESQSYKSLLVDDGTAQIRLRFFDTDTPLFEKLEVGNFAIIIGKLRHYGSEVYVTPEILKPLKNVKWAEVRKLELAVPRGQTSASNNSGRKVAAVEEELVDVVGKDKLQVYKIVKELDTGRGADLSEVALKAGLNNAESIIRDMLKNGDLFEVLPGRLKVLE